MTNYSTKRIYEAANGNDGFRVLVDRLWPRGVSKAAAALDEWCKDVAPSPDLRKSWNHDPDSFNDFAARYRAELDENVLLAEMVTRWGEHPRVTLLYGAHDHQVNHAVVLCDYISEHWGSLA